MRLSVITRSQFICFSLAFGSLARHGACAVADVNVSPAEQQQLDEIAKSYRLAENELVARFVPPFPESRKAFVDLRFQDHAQYVKSCRFFWNQDHLEFCNASLFVPVNGAPPGPALKGATLSSTIRVLTGTPDSRMIGRVDLLEQRIPGDFVRRKVAKQGPVATELARLFQSDLKDPLQLEYVTTPVETMVLSNQGAAPGQRERDITLAIAGLDPRVGIGKEQGNWNAFVAWLEDAMNLPTVDETHGLEPRKISWTYETYRWTKEELKPGWTLEDAVKNARRGILERLARELGISIQLERRPIRVLQVSIAQPPAK